MSKKWLDVYKLPSIANRIKQYIDNKISDLASTTLDAITELDEGKQEIIYGTEGSELVFNRNAELIAVPMRPNDNFIPYSDFANPDDFYNHWTLSNTTDITIVNNEYVYFANDGEISIDLPSAVVKALRGKPCIMSILGTGNLDAGAPVTNTNNSGQSRLIPFFHIYVSDVFGVQLAYSTGGIDLNSVGEVTGIKIKISGEVGSKLYGVKLELGTTQTLGVCDYTGEYKLIPQYPDRVLGMESNAGGSDLTISGTQGGNNVVIYGTDGALHTQHVTPNKNFIPDSIFCQMPASVTDFPNNWTVSSIDTVKFWDEVSSAAGRIHYVRWTGIGTMFTQIALDNLSGLRDWVTLSVSHISYVKIGLVLVNPDDEKITIEDLYEKLDRNAVHEATANVVMHVTSLSGKIANYPDDPTGWKLEISVIGDAPSGKSETHVYAVKLEGSDHQTLCWFEDKGGGYGEWSVIPQSDKNLKIMNIEENLRDILTNNETYYQVGYDDIGHLIPLIRTPRKNILINVDFSDVSKVLKNDGTYQTEIFEKFASTYENWETSTAVYKLHFYRSEQLNNPNSYGRMEFGKFDKTYGCGKLYATSNQNTCYISQVVEYDKHPELWVGPITFSILMIDTRTNIPGIYSLHISNIYDAIGENEIKEYSQSFSTHGFFLHISALQNRMYFIVGINPNRAIWLVGMKVEVGEDSTIGYINDDNTIVLLDPYEPIVTSDASLASSVSEQSTKIDQLETKTDTTNINLTTLTTRVSTAENTISSHTTSISTLVANVNTAQSTANTAKSTADTAKSSAETNTSSINSLKTKTDTTNTNVTNVANRVSTAEGNITNLLNRVAALESAGSSSSGASLPTKSTWKLDVQNAEMLTPIGYGMIESYTSSNKNFTAHILIPASIDLQGEISYYPSTKEYIRCLTGNIACTLYALNTTSSGTVSASISITSTSTNAKIVRIDNTGIFIKISGALNNATYVKSPAYITINAATGTSHYMCISS